MNKFFMITGILLISYYIVLTAIMGPITFSIYLFLLGVASCIFAIIREKFCEYPIYKKIMKFVRPLFIFGMIVFVITEFFMICVSFEKNTEKSDYTIVLGAGLRGETMSLTLKNRVDTALNYLKSYEDSGVVVVSGGQGPGESITEAEAMKRFFVNNEIDEEKILKEDKSTDTYENLKFSKEIIEKHSQKNIEDLNIKIISNGFHLMRVKFLAKSLGYENITLLGAPINPIFIPTYYFREFIGFYKMLVFDILLK